MVKVLRIVCDAPTSGIASKSGAVVDLSRGVLPYARHMNLFQVRLDPRPAISQLLPNAAPVSIEPVCAGWDPAGRGTSIVAQHAQHAVGTMQWPVSGRQLDPSVTQAASCHGAQNTWGMGGSSSMPSTTLPHEQPNVAALRGPGGGPNFNSFTFQAVGPPPQPWGGRRISRAEMDVNGHAATGIISVAASSSWGVLPTSGQLPPESHTTTGLGKFSVRVRTISGYNSFWKFRPAGP